ncbi:MAG: hypothetical protein HC899_06085 [Leptolyngbyaceae cyanobacterium SM1_4_3]|nr:hypothetical protein [Leptolyngbyaceae cyanobacterium SM1_4_3]
MVRVKRNKPYDCRFRQRVSVTLSNYIYTNLHDDRHFCTGLLSIYAQRRSPHLIFVMGHGSWVQSILLTQDP